MAPAGWGCDPRDRRGRRHPLGCILLSALCAVVAGARCLEAVGQWATNAPQPTPTRLGARTTSPALGLRQAPSPATIRRVLTALDPAVLLRHSAVEDAAVLIVDGKSLRVRTGNAPQNMALLRDAAIGVLAGLGFASIPAAYRWVDYDCFTRPLDLLEIA